MTHLISFAALFASVILLQLSAGGVGPLDVLSGMVLDFSTPHIGLLGSAHFLGFFIGCWWAPRMMGNVGHSRAFAAFTATGAMALLAHMLVVDPLAWAVMRIGSGISVAGCYTVVEAWLQAKVTNETRGRALGVYRVTDLMAQLGSQLMIAVLVPASYVSYNILALICCAALIPITLTTARQPDIPKAPRLRPLLAWEKSPMAVAAVIVAAVSSSSFRMVSPIYASEVGLEQHLLGYFMAALVAGGALAQYPVGWLADKFDRRKVLMGLSIAAIFTCVGISLTSNLSDTWILVTAILFGLSAFPIYSVAAAHAHDYAVDDERIALSAALMFWFAVGAIAAPYTASMVMDRFGPAALFVVISASHAILIIFGMWRMGVREAVKSTRYIYAPRTSFIIGGLLKGARKPGEPLDR